MIFALVVGGILSLALTVLLCIKVLPAKYDGTFSKKILQTLHDYFNFKKLYFESVLKAIFSFASISCVIGGILAATVGNVIQLIGNISYAVEYSYYYSSTSWVWSTFFSNLFGGILTAVLGPIVLRLAYELIMMFVLLVKNVIEINNKMKKSDN